jgi:hypothetical protein
MGDRGIVEEACTSQSAVRPPPRASHVGRPGDRRPARGLPGVMPALAHQEWDERPLSSVVPAE